MVTQTNLLIASFLILILIVAVLPVLLRFFNKQRHVEIYKLEEQIRFLEKQSHLNDRNFLEERNQIELANLESIKEAKKIAFEEGRQRGATEGEAKYLIEITLLQSEFAKKLHVECEKAATEARDKVRAEYELHSKLFSVQISPFVCVTENKGLIRSEYQSEVGYQYQLLINGIPAFKPHIVVERSETRREINEDNIKVLLNSAKQIADEAINMYLGANGQFAKLALPIIKRLKA